MAFMKKLFTLLFLLSGLLGKPDMQAQETTNALKDTISQEEIAVVGFRKLPNDITARVTNPKRDQNNELCALIRVVAKDKNVYFEPDALGITARTDQPGEIWLYVPRGARRLSIMHEKYGVVRNYVYPEAIDKATVYELLLYVPEERKAGEEIVRIVERKATAQMFQMEFTPADAQVYVNDTLRQAKDGKLTMVLGVGQNRYRLVRPFYYQEEGTVNIVPESPTMISVNMRLHYGQLLIKSNRKASVYIDKRRRGDSPLYLDTISTGLHYVQVECGHLKRSRQVEINDRETRIEKFRFRPDWFIMPQISMSGYDGNLSYGMMAGFCARHGVYISFRSNFNFFGSDEYYSDAFYTGKTQFFNLSANAGYLFRIVQPLYVYAGIGYDKRTLSWEYLEGDKPGSWQEMAYASGVGFEVGGIWRLDRFMLSAGYKYLLNGGERVNSTDEYLGHHEMTVGVGFIF